MKFYCGVGSRSTPLHVCSFFTDIAKELYNYGYYLRSGGADGADKAFETGAGNNKEIWLPWIGFNNSNSRLVYDYDKTYEILKSTLARQHYEKLQEMNFLSLHLRNVHQIFGDFESPSSQFVLCWTKDGKEVGGTATAIKIAKNYNISVYNFGICDNIQKCKNFWDRIKILENIS